MKHLWERKQGAPFKFDTGEALRKECLKYFQWVIDNPIMEAKLVSFQGESTIEQVPHMRAMTVHGLSLFIGIVPQTWYEWRKNSDKLTDTVAWADAVMREYKFTGAAADQLNPNIIARDLGLVDRSDVTSDDKPIAPSKEPTLEELKAEAKKRGLPDSIFD